MTTSSNKSQHCIDLPSTRHSYQCGVVSYRKITWISSIDLKLQWPDDSNTHQEEDERRRLLVERRTASGLVENDLVSKAWYRSLTVQRRTNANSHRVAEPRTRDPATKEINQRSGSTTTRPATTQSLRQEDRNG